MNIATAIIPRYFIPELESEDPEEPKELEKDELEKDELADELELESPKENDIAIKNNKTATTIIITLGFDSIPFTKLYVSVVTLPKLALIVLFIYIILTKYLFCIWSFSIEETICLWTNYLIWHPNFRNTSVIIMIPFTVCIFNKRCIMSSLN